MAHRTSAAPQAATTVAAFFFILSVAGAFSPPGGRSLSARAPSFGIARRPLAAASVSRVVHRTILRAAEEGSDASEETPAPSAEAEGAAEGSEEGVSETTDEETEEEEEEEEEEEDPEIVAIKEEIAELEKKLHSKRNDVSAMRDMAETYSKAGYLRKVAEMENIRKLRSSTFSSNKYTATATVVQSFLPVMDELKSLSDQYETDDFGSQYSGLKGAMSQALKDLDVEDFTAKVGEKIDRSRVAVVGEEYSDDFAKDVVMKPVNLGSEIRGNVMRMAEAVVSLGSEKEAEEERAAAEAEEAEAAEGGEGEASSEADDEAEG